MSAMEHEEKLLVFVDDEPNILKALKRVFFEDDFIIETFTKGQDAIEFAKENDVNLIISDQRMPEMVGTELLKEFRKIHPDSMRIILTGFADMDAAVDAINNGQIYQFVFKPWNDEELRSMVLRALETFDLQQENARLLSELMQKNNELNDLNAQLGQKVKERTALIVQKNLELGKVNRTLESSLMNSIRVFANLIELIRPAISSHAKRVTNMAKGFAKDMGWPNENLRDLEVAGLLHDIGKLAIPADILRKNKDKLTEVEKEMLNNHPILGQNMLGAIDSFNKIGQIIRSHHERWDGGGFPDGLRGEDIPKEARLLSLCNIYDHLKNDQEGVSQIFIHKFFRNNSGTTFDPKMVEFVMSIFLEEAGEEENERRLQILPHELKPGMILAHSLMTGKGIFLLPEGQLLKETHIRSIHDIQKVDPIAGVIEVILK